MTFYICDLIKILRVRLELTLCCFTILISLTFTSVAFANEILRLEIQGQSSGIVDIELNDELAPKHVERIKLLTGADLYDGVVFHRVIEGFMAQTGDIKYGKITSFEPSLVGMGGSDYPMLEQEFSKMPFVQGTVGMARSQDPNSANSQFFIMFAPAPHLDGKYTVVGSVVAGMDVVQGIKKGSRASNGSVNSPDYILTANILENN